MNKTKRSMSIIIEVLLMLSIMFGVLCIFFQVVILNRNTYTRILEKSNAYEQVKESIYSKIDAILSAKNINYDIKESIITEDDIKREADAAIPGIIDYLKTGKNNIQPVDTEVYKQRVADMIHSTMQSLIKPTGDLSYNSHIDIQNTSNAIDKYKVDEMMVVKTKAQVGQDSLKVERLMSKDEAEARVREILKQKGLTEEQAIQKAKEKGITEEQALKILAGYGITIDGDPAKDESDSNKESSGENQSKASGNNASSDIKSSSADENNKESVKSGSQKGDAKPAQSAGSQLEIIQNKLIDEADNDIEKEVEKLDLSKVFNDSRIEKIAKVTSIVYKMFWMFMSLPIIFMIILIKTNKKKIICSLKQISRAFLIAGLILFSIFAGAHIFKFYEKINIGPVYFKEIISYAIKYLLELLSVYGLITLIVGLLVFIFTSMKIRKIESKLLQIK
ncbi:hypothetical protein CDLVIII_1655 [Clostridium sp. DL-VIII]|uniref:DUF4199 domain-containing protein n=1 Tax=Clostridium sp. DL-VIII TaxID=641107 RepID=UPI00023AFD18|nr:DUF4199 domain-containing protein [Clostridium sp. DL-VIII]EHI98346.1 hypothetical protein CDLVIII_1655 [Clostridium sp. DL-VIII]